MKAIIIEQERLRELFDNFKLVMETKAVSHGTMGELVELRTIIYQLETMFQKIESSK